MDSMDFEEFLELKVDFIIMDWYLILISIIDGHLYNFNQVQFNLSKN